MIIKNSERVSSAVVLPQRVGEGVSPTERACVNIPRELPAERIFPIRHGRLPTVSGAAYDGTCNIGGIAKFDLRPVWRDGGFFIVWR